MANDDTPIPSLMLNIESVAYGGKGVARQDGKVFFVPDTVPGDRVEAKVLHEKPRYAEAKPLRLATASTLRGASLCTVSDLCGGCQWQGIDYNQQLEWKKSFVTSALKRVGRLPAETPIYVVPSPTSQGYRNRVHLKGAFSRDGSLQLGYYRRWSHDLVPVPGCAIASGVINRMIAELCAHKFPDQTPGTFRLELQDIPAAASDGTAPLLATVFPDEGSGVSIEALVAHLRASRWIRWAGSVMDTGDAEPIPFERDLGVVFHSLPFQFQQIHTPLNQALRREVAALVTEARAKRVLDLFCGSGNLSLAIAATQPDAYIEGIENGEQAIRAARFNLSAAGLNNAIYLRGETEPHLWKCAKKGEVFDLVIADPPRSGMYRELIPLMKIAPKHIVYVSCDPTTLARDLGSLCRKHYSLRSLTLYDFFPNTFHIETVAVLERVTAPSP